MKKLLDENPINIKKLALRKSNICVLDDLSACVNLTRIDASHNVISDATALTKCAALNWMNLSSNRLDNTLFMSGLLNISVLNLGKNLLTDITNIAKLTNLKALILNDNKIRDVCDLSSLKSLNTLVLSNNELHEIDVHSCTALTKLQLSHNAFVKFPNISKCLSLKQLSLNNNLIAKVPLKSVGELESLEIIDLGRNNLTLLKSIKTLTNVVNLKRLDLKGNPVCDNTSLRIKVAKWFPNLDSLNSDKFTKENYLNNESEVQALANTSLQTVNVEETEVKKVKEEVKPQRDTAAEVDDDGGAKDKTKKVKKSKECAEKSTKKILNKNAKLKVENLRKESDDFKTEEDSSEPEFKEVRIKENEPTPVKRGKRSKPEGNSGVVSLKRHKKVKETVGVTASISCCAVQSDSFGQGSESSW